MDWWLNLLVVFVGILLCVLWCDKRPHNFPPGPIGLPLVGYYPFLGKLPFKTLMELGKKYGGIYSIKIGNANILVVNKWKSVKEVLINQSEVFAGRPVTYSFNEVRRRLDISGSDGEEWREKRNFTLQSLKSFGYGKSAMENAIVEEVNILIRDLKSKVGQKVNIQGLFFNGLLNVIWISAAGRRIEPQEQEEKQLADIVGTLIQQASNSNPLQYAPMWKYLPKYQTTHATYLEMNKKMYDFIDSVIDEHIATFKDGCLRDFIDVYLEEGKKQKLSKNDAGVYHRDHLRGILYNLTNGGVDTGNSTLEFTLMYIATWPEIQYKVHEELDRVVGRERRPCYGDRKMLPYTEAVLLEVQRFASVLPFLFLHAPRKTTNVFGHTIPKGTFTLINSWAVHHDPDYWGDPELFRPERFLNEQGEVVAPEYLIPFSAGLMQQFSFSCVPGEPPILEPDVGLVVHPPPFSLIIKSR